MFDTEGYTRKFTDMMSEGFIFIDSKGRIQIYNNKAKEIFGIIYNQDKGHEIGRVEEGDIVIIGDNCIGKDDGGLNSEGLSLIGIKEKDIEPGDAIVAIGLFRKKGTTSIYKHQRPNEGNETLELHNRFLSKDISCSINFIDKVITIKVDNESFKMKYINAIGHMVVLDGKTKELKFYQAQGYTARGESIYDLLLGKEYRAKGENSESLDVIGKDIFEIHSGGSTIQEFYDAATGKEISYINEFKEINGRPTICTLLPVDQDGKRVGSALKVEDISEIKRVSRERDEALLHLEEIEKRLSEEKDVLKLFPEILGESKEINYVKNLAYRAAKTNTTLLLLGESGTGKSLLAKVIHSASKNRNRPFIHVNCGSIPETLLESELFGYEKGSFTGAKNEGKPGMFELANGGTIFLDEIGEISLALQVKLLQVLQDKSFFKIGGSKNITVDVRIIAATNKNLEEEMLKGKFREDLYYRINVFPIWIPPLRERKQDIYSLVHNMLPTICQRIGCDVKRISGEALHILSEYDWPGNIRELENVLERAVNLAEGNTILSNHLSLFKKSKEVRLEGGSIKPLKEIVKDAEKKAIKDVLSVYNGNKNLAMKALKLGKTCFYEKLKKYDID